MIFNCLFLLLAYACGHVTGSARDETDETATDCHWPRQLQQEDSAGSCVRKSRDNEPPRCGGGLVFDQRVIHAVGMCGRNGCSTKNGGAYQYEDWKRRNQAVDAPRLNSSLSISRGVAPPRICRGVSLSSFCTHATCSGVTVAKSVPFL